MSQEMILDKQQSITLADTRTNLAGMPSGPIALFVSKDLIILLNARMVTMYCYNIFNGKFI